MGHTLALRLADALNECGHDITWADILDALDAAGLGLVNVALAVVEEREGQK